MIGLFRRFLSTWTARLFFLLLVGTFGLWGVADVVRNIGADSSGALATVGSQKITPEAFTAAFRPQLARISQMFGAGGSVPPQIAGAVGQQVLERLITRAAIAAGAERMGLTVTDDALRQTIFTMPDFRGTDGQFSRTTFEALLRRARMTEPQFITTVREELLLQQLVGSVRAGAGAPDVLLREMFAFQAETRVADMVELPFAAIEPPAPTDIDLHRYYDNNPDTYRAPEYRRIKAVILSVDTIARSIEVTDQEIQTAYALHRGDYVQPEKRSVQVAVSQDEAKANALAEQWRSGAEWSVIEQAAKDGGGSTVTLDDAGKGEFPAPELGEAVFNAGENIISGPVHTPLGWQVLRVTKITPEVEKTVDQARDELRGKIALEKARDVIDARANKVQDALASGSSLDELPTDLGLFPETGTLDSQGNTPQGEPAPVPGGDALRRALIAQAFELHKGDAPRWTEQTDAATNTRGYYAVIVEDITPPAMRPFESVAEKVKADWQRDAARHAQEEAAAKLLAAVKGGQSLDDASTVAGVRMTRSLPVGRSAPPAGFPREGVEPLFGLKQGEAATVQTGDGYVVVVLEQIIPPDPVAQAAAFAELRKGVVTAVGNDVEQVYVSALRRQAEPRVNRQMFDAAIQN